MPRARHPGTSANRSHWLNRQRAAWWLAVPNLAAGRKWFDLMGAYHGTLTGGTTAASWKPPARPGAWGHVAVDGSAGYVDCGSVPARDTLPVTLAAWVRPSSLASIGTIFGSASAGGTANFLQFRVNTSGFLELVNSGVALIGTGTTALAVGAWARCLAVLTASTWALYVNGRASGSGSHAQAFIAQPVALGTRYPASAEYFSGSLDDCTIWGARTLTATDAWADYTLSSLGYPGVLARPTSRTLIVPAASAVGAVAPTRLRQSRNLSLVRR